MKSEIGYTTPKCCCRGPKLAQVDGDPQFLHICGRTVVQHVIWPMPKIVKAVSGFNILLALQAEINVQKILRNRCSLLRSYVTKVTGYFALVKCDAKTSL